MGKKYIDDLVSIITPVYNAERFIEETIKSVKSQTYKNWEMILIDDCSTDSSAEIIKEFIKFDNRIIYIKLGQNGGAAVARNVGLDLAKGRYIAFLDSDDMWKEEKLEKQIYFMKKNKYGFTFTSYEMIDEHESIPGKVVKVPKQIDYNGLLRNTIIGCLTVIIDRKIVGDFHMPLIRKGQDTATWLSILKKYEYAYSINETLAYYRVVKGSVSSNKIEALKRTWYVYRHIEQIPLIKCTYFYINYIFNAVKKKYLY